MVTLLKSHSPLKCSMYQFYARTLVVVVAASFCKRSMPIQTELKSLDLVFSRNQMFLFLHPARRGTFCSENMEYSTKKITTSVAGATPTIKHQKKRRKKQQKGKNISRMIIIISFGGLSFCLFSLPLMLSLVRSLAPTSIAFNPVHLIEENSNNNHHHHHHRQK